MTTEPQTSSGETLPVEQLAGHHVGSWITVPEHHGIAVSGYLLGLEVSRAVINDTRLCEANSRFVEHNTYSITIYGHGEIRLLPWIPVTVEPADPSLGVALARVEDSLRAHREEVR